MAIGFEQDQPVTTLLSGKSNVVVEERGRRAKIRGKKRKRRRDDIKLSVYGYRTDGTRTDSSAWSREEWYGSRVLLFVSPNPVAPIKRLAASFLRENSLSRDYFACSALW
jgi:hypothetical protein